VASLRAAEYYAHPQNQFWPIMAALLGFDPRLVYAERRAALLASRIAVWDVCAAAVRPGSLDANIRAQSIKANDFAGFLSDHPAIALIAFNGAAAERLYRDQVLPRLRAPQAAIASLRLPSTSPAHASLTLAAKRRQWSVIKEYSG
jgi:TDG/mug DNA glycosylase family protein